MDRVAYGRRAYHHSRRTGLVSRRGQNHCKKDRDLRNLKGQTVGVYLDSPAVHFFLYQYLAANKIGLSDVRIVELDVEGLADNFIAGRFPAIVSFDPQALRAEREGNGQLAATSALYSGCIPEGYAARTDVLKDIPAADLVKIFRGWIEAVRWIREEANWEEYRQILNNRTFADEKPYSDSDLKQMFNAVSIHDMTMLTKRNKNEGGLFTFLGQLRGMLKENKMLRKGFDPREIFDNRAIMEGIQGYQ